MKKQDLIISNVDRDNDVTILHINNQKLQVDPNTQKFLNNIK